MFLIKDLKTVADFCLIYQYIRVSSSWKVSFDKTLEVFFKNVLATPLKLKTQ